MTDEVVLLGKGLAVRLADVRAAMERLGAFAFTPGARDDAGGPVELGAAEAAAREMVRRALAVAGDAVTARMLESLAGADATIAELAALTGLPADALWLRIGDLVDAGLASRSLEHERVGLTAAGQALAALVAAVVQAVIDG